MPYSDPIKQKEAQQKHYLNNKSKYREANARRRKKQSDYINTLKETACADCQQKYPYYVMDFDHRGEEIKVTNIAKMITRYSWDMVLKEINKCDVVCSNCHRIRSHIRKMRD